LRYAADVDLGELVGLAEIAELLGVSSHTVTSWRQRGQLPDPRWSLKSGPVWLADEVKAWFERRSKDPDIAVAPDRVSEAIDLAAEPGRAEVYAHYGLAMGMAQMVELELGTVLVLLGQTPKKRSTFMKQIEDGDRKTLGQLKADLAKTGAPVLGISYLERVVATRNLLAHHYLRDPERNVMLNTEDGRARLINELDAAARDFFLTSQHLRSAQVRLAIGKGVSKNDIIQRIHALRAGVTPENTLGQRAAIMAKGSPDAIKVIEDEFERAQRPP
jgi:predicted DNA-binding transcriptional regulator AlpA